MQEKILERLRVLLDEGKGDRVLAWAQGETDYERTPAVFTAATLGDLKYDSFCGSNLTKYLINDLKKEGNVIALIKPCDSYSLNQLCTEHRVDRDRVYAIAVGCEGKIDVEKLRAMGIKGITSVEENGDTLTVKTLYGDKTVARKDALLDKCLRCKGKEHKAADETIGESKETTQVERFSEVAALEAKTPAERALFWKTELDKCIHCYACRNVCPACSCEKCVFDNPDLKLTDDMYHIVRAFHVAGRCTDCGECSRVCPQHIPLHLLNKKFIKDIDELYGEYQAGEAIGQRHPLISYTKEDAEPSIVLERGAE